MILFEILKLLLGAGLAGILIIIGIVSVVTWITRQIIVNVYYAIHTSKKSKGGD